LLACLVALILSNVTIAGVLGKAPLKYITVILATISVAAFLLTGSGNYLGLGLDGMDGMGAYPMFLWTVAFGAYLMRGLD